MLEFDDSCYVDAKQYRLASFSTRNSTLIKYLASLTNQNARFYYIMRFFMKGCCVDFPIQMTQNCKHSKCLQILAEEDFPLKLLWRTPIKIHRRADRRRQPRSREHRSAQRRQRRQHSDHKRVQRQQQNTTITV